VGRNVFPRKDSKWGRGELGIKKKRKEVYSLQEKRVY